METAISVKNISKSYRLYKAPSEKLKELLHPFGKKYHREFWALRDMSFEIKKGESVGIIGRNGSGKSTLLKLICGVLQPTAGEVLVNGRVSALLELGAGFNPDYTGRQNVYMNGALRGLSKGEMDERFEPIIEFADIGDFLDQPVKTYSSGMYVRLAFSCAVNVDPDILIVDEALAVGDDIFKRRCYRKLEQFKDEGKTILFVSHSLGTVVSTCTRAIMIEKGTVVDDGDPKSVIYAYNKLLASLDAARGKKQQGEGAGRSRTAQTPLQEAEDHLIDKEGTQQKDGEAPVSETRYGTGEADLDIDILDENGRPVRMLISGDTYLIMARASFNRVVADPVIGFNVRTLNGIMLLGTNTQWSENPIGPVSSGEVVTVEFEQKMLLNPGSYCLTASLVETSGDANIVLDRRLDAIAFQVIGKVTTHGFLKIDTPIRIGHELVAASARAIDK